MARDLKSLGGDSMPVRVRPRAVPGLPQRSDEVLPCVSVRNRDGPGGPRRAIDKSINDLIAAPAAVLTRKSTEKSPCEFPQKTRISGTYGSGRSMIAIPKAFPPPG